MDIFEKTINTLPFRTLTDKRPTDAIVTRGVTLTIGPVGSTPNVCIMRLPEIPLEGEGVTGITGATGNQVFDIFVTEYGYGPYCGKIGGVPTTKTFLADSDTYLFGYIEFSADDIGRVVTVTYKGRGSAVFASDINELATGALIRDHAIRPRHIFLGGTGPDGETGSSDFLFATNVDIGGDLHIVGNLNIEGVVNKSVSEVIDITDDIILLNSGATMPGPDVGLEVDRGGLNPQMVWDEGDDAWEFKGTTGDVLFAVYDNKTVEIGSGGLLKPPTRDDDPVPTVDMIPGIYYNSTDRQTKQIVSDGLGGAKIVILG